MSKLNAEVISRRKAFSLLGLATLCLTAPAAVLTVSDAEAQQPAPGTAPPTAPETGTERRQERRTGRTRRRTARRKVARSDVSCGAEAERRKAARSSCTAPAQGNPLRGSLPRVGIPHQGLYRRSIVAVVLDGFLKQRVLAHQRPAGLQVRDLAIHTYPARKASGKVRITGKGRDAEAREAWRECLRSNPYLQYLRQPQPCCWSPPSHPTTRSPAATFVPFE